MKTININRRIGMGLPEEEGRRLAVSMLSDGSLDAEELLFDARDCDSARLISAFIFAWLQEICNVAPDSLPKIEKAKWLTTYPFQEACIAEWIAMFEPYGGRSTEG